MHDETSLCFCHICGKQIIGWRLGFEGRWAHQVCIMRDDLDHWREASQRYRDAYYSYRALGEPLDEFNCVPYLLAQLKRLWKEAQAEAEERVCEIIGMTVDS